MSNESFVEMMKSVQLSLDKRNMVNESRSEQEEFERKLKTANILSDFKSTQLSMLINSNNEEELKMKRKTAIPSMLEEYFIPRGYPEVMGIDGNVASYYENSWSNYDSQKNVWDLKLGGDEDIKAFYDYMKDNNFFGIKTKNGDYINAYNPTFVNDTIKLVQESWVIDLFSKDIVFSLNDEKVDINSIYNLYVVSIVDKIGLGE